MSIIILAPDPAHCRPFYVAQQLETAAWGHGATEAEAVARMMEHRKYKAEVEAATPDPQAEEKAEEVAE